VRSDSTTAQRSGELRAHRVEAFYHKHQRHAQTPPRRTHRTSRSVFNARLPTEPQNGGREPQNTLPARQDDRSHPGLSYSPLGALASSLFGTMKKTQDTFENDSVKLRHLTYTTQMRNCCCCIMLGSVWHRPSAMRAKTKSSPPPGASVVSRPPRRRKRKCQGTKPAPPAPSLSLPTTAPPSSSSTPPVSS